MGFVGKSARLLVLAVRYRQGIVLKCNALKQRGARLRKESRRSGDCVAMSLAFVTGISPKSFPLSSKALNFVEWSRNYSARLAQSGLGLAVVVIPGRPHHKGEWIGIVPQECHAVVMKGDRCIFDPSGGILEGTLPEIYGQLYVKPTS